MPGPVPKHITGFNGGALNIVRAEPLCMAHVAAVAVAWSEIERALALFFSAALGSSRFQAEDVVECSTNQIASVIMEQAETIRLRIKFVDATVEPLLRGSPFHDRWAAIRTALRKRSRQRNEVVHANWTYTAELPGELVRLRPNNRERWTIKDFEEIQRDFHDLRISIDELMHDVGAANARGELPKW